MDNEFRNHIFESSKAVNEGRVYLSCPACSSDRSSAANRKKEVLAVSYEFDQAVYFCNHCGISGHAWKDELNHSLDHSVKPMEWERFDQLGQADLDYLSGRGIDAAKLDLLSDIRYFNSDVESASAIGFPYVLDQNIKWIARDVDGKKLCQWEAKGGVKNLYRHELIDYSDSALIICEGEIDCESARHLGFNAVSCANGAPTSFQAQKALKNINARLNSFDRVVIAMDADDKGQAASEALVELVGRKRAHTVKYPAGCGDLNEILTRFGPDTLRSVLTNTEPSMSGIVRAREFFPAIDTIRRDGFVQGTKIGIEQLDNLVTWHPGSLVVVTGEPGIGKSTLVDEVCCRLADKGWKFGMFSPENSPELHVSKLAACHAGAPIIGEDVLADEHEYQRAREWVDENFLFISSEQCSIKSILDRADACIAQLRPEGPFGLVIDPWNYISDTGEGSETQSINAVLAQAQCWGLENNAMVVVVCHPTKAAGQYGTQSGYSISGSAHFYNRASLLLSLQADKKSFETDVHVLKTRHRWFGTNGTANLTFDLSTGRYRSRMGNTKALEEIDWSSVEKGDRKFDGHDEFELSDERPGRGETDNPEPPEAQLEMDVEIEVNDEPVPF